MDSRTISTSLSPVEPQLWISSNRLALISTFLFHLFSILPLLLRCRFGQFISDMTMRTITLDKPSDSGDRV
jgi:hypothetical protein